MTNVANVTNVSILVSNHNESTRWENTLNGLSGGKAHYIIVSKTEMIYINTLRDILTHLKNLKTQDGRVQSMFSLKEPMQRLETVSATRHRRSSAQS